MTKPLVIFSIICALCWGYLIYTFSRMNQPAIEEVDDPAWVCAALDKAEKAKAKEKYILLWLFLI